MNEPVRETTRREYLTPVADTRSRQNLAVDTTAVDVDGRRLPWVKHRNAKAGVLESRWLAEHRDDLRPYQGQWIAILGQRVLVSKPSMKDTYDFLRSQGYADALVLKVPVEGADPRHRIAHAQNRNLRD